MQVLQSKMTLLPHGRVQSSDASNDKLLGFLLACGADHQRILDQQFPTTDRLIRYLSRLNDLKQPHTRALVALTQTCPVSNCIIRMRLALCDAFPVLDAALWIIFADPELDPAFYETAGRIGKFDTDLDNAPVWEDPYSNRYLVITPNTNDEHANLRCRMLNAHTESSFLRRERPSTTMKTILAANLKP